MGAEEGSVVLSRERLRSSGKDARQDKGEEGNLCNCWRGW